MVKPAITHTPWAEAPPDFAIGLRPIAREAWPEGGEARGASPEFRAYKKLALYDGLVEAFLNSPDL